MILTYLDLWIRSIISSTSINQIELEAIAPLLDATFSKLLSPEQLQSLSPPGILLLKLCLDHPTKEPLILSNPCLPPASSSSNSAWTTQPKNLSSSPNFSPASPPSSPSSSLPLTPSTPSSQRFSAPS